MSLSTLFRVSGSRLAGHDTGLASLVMFTDPSWAASLSVGGEIMIWDLFGDVCVHHLWLEMKDQPQWSMFISQVAFFPLFNQDRDFCFAVPDDLDVALWDIHGNAIARLRAHQQRVLRCAWSPNGHWLASASADQIRLWKISACKRSEHHEPRHESMKSSPSHSPLVVDACHRIL